jgi:hypothetical protein
MEKIFGRKYYIDLDAVTEVCEIIGTDVNLSDENELILENNEENKGVVDSPTINVFKYDIVKLCIERIINDGTDLSDLNGLNLIKMSPSFLIAFNTLINSGIISEENE